MSFSRQRYIPPFCACAASPSEPSELSEKISFKEFSFGSDLIWRVGSGLIWRGVRSQVEKRGFDFLQKFLFCSDASVPVWSEQVCGMLQKKYLKEFSFGSDVIWRVGSGLIWRGVRSLVEKHGFDFLQTFLLCSDASVPVWSEQVCSKLYQYV